MEEIRLNKYLSDMGICSRREADRLVEAGKVMVDGRQAVLGMKIRRDQRVVCDGKTVGTRIENRPGQKADRIYAESDYIRRANAESNHIIKANAGKNNIGSDSAERGYARPAKVLLAVNKPRGVVCTTSDKDRAVNIVEMVGYPDRVYPVGRLDKDSEGLIFLTNQGELVNQMMRGANGHEKEYVVWVDKPVTEEFARKMEAGVYLEELGVTTRSCKVRITGTRQFHIILTQGLNRQIRRMCQAFGYHVRGLRRIRIMNVKLGDLKVGTWRKVTPEEYKILTDMLRGDTGKSGATTKFGTVEKPRIVTKPGTVTKTGSITKSGAVVKSKKSPEL